MITLHPPALMHKTVPIAVIRHIVFGVALVSLADLHVPGVVGVAGDEVGHVDQVARVTGVVLKELWGNVQW